MLPNDKKRKGTGFTNIANILGANKGSRLGETITSGVGGVAKETRAGLEKAGKEFETKVSGSLPSQKEEEELKQLTVGFETPSGTSGMGVDQGGYQRERQKFSDYLGRKYEGPTEIENKERLQSSVAQTEELGRLGETTGGRQELLRRFVGGRDYTRGEQALDTALLGATGQQELSKAARETKGLGDVFSRVIGRTEGLAKKATSELEQSQENVKKQVQQSLGNIIEKEVNPLLTAAQKREERRVAVISDLDKILSAEKPALITDDQFKNIQRRELSKKLQEISNEGFIDQDTLNSLIMPSLTRVLRNRGVMPPIYDYNQGFLDRALSEGNIQELMGDLKSIIGSAESAKNLTNEAFATEEQSARLSALQKILGQKPSYEENKEEFKEGEFLPESKIKEFKIKTLDKEIKRLEDEYKNQTIQAYDKLTFDIEKAARQAKMSFREKNDLLENLKKYMQPQNGRFPSGNEGIIDLNKHFKGISKAATKLINKYNETIKARNENSEKVGIPRLNVLDEIKGISQPNEPERFRDPTDIPVTGYRK